jgi:hypothetical protein
VNTMNTMAIDPGKSGGICIIQRILSGTWIERHTHISMPLATDELPDVGMIQQLIISYSIRMVVLEKQRIGARQSSQSVIMEAYGMLKATAILCGCGVIELTPQQWQKALNLDGDKQGHIDYAIAAGYDIPFTSYNKDGSPRRNATRHDGIADACCMIEAWRELQ